MKKIFILLSVFIISILFYSTSLAVTTPSEGTIVATVSINNAKIISNNGRDYKISFDISNRVGAQPQVKYSVRLMQNDTLVDEKVYEETLSLGDNTTISKTIDYTIPSSIPLGTYSIWIDSKNENGLMLGVAIAGDVKITEAVPNTIEIIPGSCYLGQSLLSQGVVISSTDTFTAKCKVTSSLSSNITLIPSFITRSHTSFGDIVPTTGSSTGNVIIKNGSNDITLILPKASKPQDYNLTFNLVSADKKTISNSISFNYILSGQSGTIQNVVFDKTSYKAGETANLQIFSTQTGTSTITAIVLNSDGYCSATSTKDISNFSVVNLLIPITKDCNNPKANVILSAGSNILDSRNFQIATPISTTTSATSMSANKIIIASILILLAFIFIVLIYKKRHLGIRVFIFAVIFSSVIFISGKAEAQFFNPFPGPWFRCSGEYGTCNVGSGTPTMVRFGADTRWRYAFNITGSIACNNATFGGDPAVGTVKECDAMLPPPPTELSASCPAPGTTATISWRKVLNVAHDIRVDNTTNGWNGLCSGGQLPGDVCFRKAAITITCMAIGLCDYESYSFASTPGVTYTWWVHAVDPSTGVVGNPSSGPAFSCSFPVCTSWTWGTCSPTTRTQTVVSTAPSGCVGGYPAVQACIPAPTATLSASPSTVSSSQYATLSGTVTDVSSCTLAGGPLGTRAWSSNGAYSYNSGSLTSNTPFVLSCSGPGGSVTKNVTVSVVPLIPININLNASPLTVQVGSSSMISWNVTGANSCTVVKNGAAFSTATSGSKTSGPITSATTFTAQCINAGNSATKSVIVDITALPQPQLTLNADETQIVWEATEADSCTLKQDGTVVSTDMSGSIPADNLAQGIEFILKCIGPGGTTSTSTKSVAPAIRSTCTPTQAGNAPGDNNIYVNRNTTWTANLSASGTTITSRTWSGTNIPSTTGLTLNKIYTTVGLKYINATTTGKRSDNSAFTSHCSATTTVKLDTGTGWEI